ncbi:hypothetical protein OROHE_013532 [Orobanche hederae]
MDSTYIRAMADQCSMLLISLCLLVLLNTQLVRTQFINITFVDSAVSKGAVCMGGSPPAYSLARGSGSGVNNWFIYIEGGGWCVTRSECHRRSEGWLGTSYSRTRNYYDGLLTQNQTYNPDFYNWNRVSLIYCDGSSFFGDVEEPDTQTNVTYRGSRVFNAIMEDLLAKGMNNADNVLLAGGSAGGLATILHCDGLRALVPNANRVKCISDSGFFIHAKNLPGAKEREDYFTKVVELHGLQKHLPESCTSRMNPGLCLFPEYLVEDIQTPLFILESLFDSHQIKEMLTPYIGGGKPEWNNCVNQSLTFCNSTQIEIMQEFRKTFIDTLRNLKYSSSRGMFVHNCYLHTHLLLKEETMCSSLVNNVLENKTIREAISDWFFDRSCFQHIDTNNDEPQNCTSGLSSAAFSKECIDYLKNNHIKLVV